MSDLRDMLIKTQDFDGEREREREREMVKKIGKLKAEEGKRRK
jgi:hypothetical protein